MSFRYGYTGRELDLESGLDYYRARYYDPANGRFISVDPMGFGAGDTNLYRYVGNSSTNAIDPTGMWELPASWNDNLYAADKYIAGVADLATFGATTSIRNSLYSDKVAGQPTIIVEHYSQYLKPEHIDSCTLRKQVYWYSENDSRTDSSDDLRLDKHTTDRSTPLSPDMPFTWILTSKCGSNLLRRTRAEPDPIFGKHVYRLDPHTGIGIVVLEKLPYSADTMLLKLLSNDPDTVLRAYRDIERLSADLPLANDIISACNEYCIHIQGLGTESLDPQEVTTMSILQQEPAYQKRIKELQAEGEARGEARGKLNTVKKLLSVKFGNVSPEIEAKLTSMTADDLDDLLIRSLDWNTSKSLFDYFNIPTSPN